MEDLRDEIVKELRWSFFGPDHSDEANDKQRFDILDLYRTDPGGIYITGILSPLLRSSDDDSSLDDSPFTKTGSSDSSFGFTFCLPKNCEKPLVVGGELSIYERGKNKDGKEIFLRKPSEFKYNVDPTDLSKKKRMIWDVLEFGKKKDKIQLVLTKRVDISNDHGDIYTLSIMHLGKEESSKRSWQRTAFHVSVFADSREGFEHLPEGANDLTEDKRRSSLLYRNVKRYAIGHGCGTEHEEGTNIIRSTFFPSVEVPVFTHKDLSSKTLEMSYWNNSGSDIELLKEIPIDYSEWVRSTVENSDITNSSLKEILKENEDRTTRVVERINNGIKRLREDPRAFKAFRYMNQAMLIQQIRSKTKLVPVQEVNGILVEGNEVNWSLSDPPSWPVDAPERFGKWRLFQMAFVLMCLDDVCQDKKDTDLDLIWFPTGGGKTEAYLGLSAFLLLYERLNGSDHSGVKIIMRYTLRLLTAQQFERAASLIVALDDIRSKNPTELGGKRFSIGLWVGGEVTYNSHGLSTGKAVDKPKNSNEWFDTLKFSNYQSWPWVLQKCPRCSREFGLKKLNDQKYCFGVKRDKNATKVFFSCKCCNGEDNSLPIYIVDEDIYSELPSIVIGTVDKFARLSWNPHSAKILGVNSKGIGEHSKLSMIIQDELHLLDGPLGTIAGLYEAAIDLLISRTGAHPKRIGSSATLAMAKEQCRDLYGVDPDSVNVFPPPLLDWNDNYFSYADKDKPGRKYVGLYANGSPSNKTTEYRLFASLLQTGGELIDNQGSKADGYTTLVNYFNSTKDMGHALSLMGDDVPRELKQLRERFGFTSDRYKKVDINDGLVQLHGNVKSDKVQKDMQRLLIEYGSPRHVHTVLATNMISVGLDVPRLALMSIIHQPKSMSEYIQASSRVGRGGTPGIVFVMLSSLRMRDRSHLEDFAVTHQKMYSLVEPSSLTPFSLSSLERALPGALIAIFRNDPRYGARDEMRAIPNQLIELTRDFFIERLKRVDPSEMDNFLDLYNEFCRSWNSGRYKVFGREVKVNKVNVPLMVPFLTPTPDWDPQPFQVLQAMRNVDSDIELKQIKQ